MGVSPSVPLTKPYSDFQSWYKEKYDDTLEIFTEGEFDYIIESHEVQELLDCSIEEAGIIVKSMCFSPGIINTNSLMISIIALSDVDHLYEKVPMVFDLMDVEREGQLSQDEMIILLMCIGESFMFILNVDRTNREKVYDAVIEFGKALWTSLGKNYTQSISRHEFTRWVKTHLFEKDVVTIDKIFASMVPDATVYEPHPTSMKN